ncbi:MAG: tetratricopeptide repeat protein, partial [Thermodesulfobacteriota bacterium]
LGWIYYKRGNLDKALEFLQKASEFVSDDPTVMEHLGDVYNDKGNTLKALEYYERSLDLNREEDKELEERVEKKINMIRQKLNAKSREEKNVH